MITIAVGKERRSKKVFNNLTIKLVPAYTEVVDENIPYLDNFRCNSEYKENT